KEINFVLSVTRNGGISVHQRSLPGNIVSVSTIKNFALELKDYGIKGILIVIDRGFYSEENLRSFKFIGAIPSNLKVSRDIISESKDIDRTMNYISYNGETIFFSEHKEEKRFIVYYSLRRKSEQLDSFLSSMSGIQDLLNEVKNR
ncbi:transposase, IS4, partial [mine drainage metagenome]